MVAVTAGAGIALVSHFDRGPTGRAYASLDEWAASSAPALTLLERYCVECHNSLEQAGGVALDGLRLANIGHDAATWEAVIRKLRAGLMPPEGNPRPERDALDALVQWLGNGLDLAWEAAPNPGAEPVARLNRTQYQNAIRDLLAFDATALVRTLPADAVAGGFDNRADLLTMSPTLLEGYLSVAMQISAAAVGNVNTSPTQVVYAAAGGGAQARYLEGLPLGTRGGLITEHHFPVDAEYAFNVAANIPVPGRNNASGRMVWCAGPQLEILFNGTALAVENPQAFRVQVPAGTHTIGIALVDDQQCVGAAELLLGDADGVAGSVRSLEIDGPYNITGAGETPSRQAIFVCQPEAPAAEPACARDILSHLATRAYRRPVAAADPAVDRLMQFYESGREAAAGDFEGGIVSALTWLLVDPQFLYRFEAEAAVAAGEAYAITDLELASRLSFFLWSSIPDAALLAAAASGELRDETRLARQITRMLADPRADALLENFVGQWLKLRDLDAVAPQDRAFDPALREAMRQETLLFFASIAREERSLLTLLDADFTFLNERLATHYGIDGIWGEYMRRVTLPDDSPRRGLLGQGSLLTTTSAANRTSPVVRGAWIVENLLGAHVPSPPPGVETNLEADAADRNAPADTLRQRLELHRADPTCAACHQIMDPIGFALENFDLIGRWRTLDNGLPINATATLVDGTLVDSPATLRAALLARPDAFIASISERLLTYALGRALTHHDGPAVRGIMTAAGEDGMTFPALVSAVVMSDPFRQRIRPDSADPPPAAVAAATGSLAGDALMPENRRRTSR